MIADQLDEELTREMLDLLILELPDHKQDLCAAWQTGDYEAMGRLVHKLHGGALYCYVPGLVDHLQVMKASLAGRKAETIHQSLRDTLAAIDEILNRD